MLEEVDRIIDEIHVKGISIPGPFEYLFDEDEVVELESLTDNQLKAFMEYGTIYFGSRDDELYSDFLDYELNNKHIIVKFSG